MSPRRPMAVLAVAVLAMVAEGLAADAAAQTMLRWKFQSGAVLNQVLVQESTTSMNLGGQTIETKLTMTVDSQWTVTKVDPQGTADIIQTVPRLRMQMVSPLMGTTSVDTASDAEPKDPIAKGLKSVTEARVTFRMNPRGEISQVQTEALAGGAAAGGNPLGPMLGKDGLVNLIKQSTYPLPGQSVGAGAAWQQKLDIEVPVLGKMTADTTLTYLGPQQVEGRSLEVISTDTTTSLAPGAGGATQPQLSIKEQSDKGTMYFDNQAGRFSHSEAVQSMKMQVNFAGQMVEQSVKTLRKARLTPAVQK